MARWQHGGASGISPEVAKNLRPEHIDKALDHADSAHRRHGEDRKDSRRSNLYLALIVGLLGLFLATLLVFTDNAQIVSDHFDAVLGFAIGVFGGYGYGARKS